MRDEREVAEVSDPRLAEHEHPDHARDNGSDPGRTPTSSSVDVEDARPDPDLTADEERAAEEERTADEERAVEERPVDAEPMRSDDLGDGELSERELPPTGEPIDAREPVPPPDEAAPEDYRERDAVPMDTEPVDAATTDAGAEPAETPDAGLWDSSDVESMRERWREIQLQFVDDPQAAAGDAAALVDEAARSLIAAVESRRAAMAGPTTDDTEPETERLRLALQRYRDFLERVLRV